MKDAPYTEAGFISEDQLWENLRYFLKKIVPVSPIHIRGNKYKFQETFHDDGQNNMFEAIQTYQKIGFDGPVRVDHVPTLEGENNQDSGYESMGRLFAIGYLKGLLDGATSK